MDEAAFAALLPRPIDAGRVQFVKIVWTRHASDRQKEWERKLGITRQEVEALVRDPTQSVPGDGGIVVAQGRRGAGLLRVPCLEAEGNRKILTVYWTSKTDKYWKGDGDAEDPL
ncbi:MAG: hypothetical protein NTAFB01_12460 [Nitrospira sp.]